MNDMYEANGKVILPRINLYEVLFIAESIIEGIHPAIKLELILGGNGRRPDESERQNEALE